MDEYDDDADDDDDDDDDAGGAESDDVSSEALVSAAPRGSRQGVLHSSVRARMAGMSRVVCLVAAAAPAAFRADSEDVSGEALVLALLIGGPPGVLHGLRSRPNGGDVSGGLPVLVLNIPCFRRRF